MPVACGQCYRLPAVAGSDEAVFEVDCAADAFVDGPGEDDAAGEPFFPLVFFVDDVDSRWARASLRFSR